MKPALTADGPERFALGINNCRSLDNVISSIRAAEQLGAELAFVSEDISCRDAFQLCALAAQSSTSIRLSTGVVNPYTRNPMALAMAAATLDEASGGRAVLGLGTSSPSLISDQLGIDPGKTVGVMREATVIVRALLAGERVTHRGERFTYHEAELEIRPIQPRIPIFYAAMGPRMLTLAGRLADGVLLNVGASPEYVRWAVSRVQEGAAEVGRDISELTIAAWLAVYVTEDREAGLAAARRGLARMLSVPRQGELLLEHARLDASILDGVRSHFQAYPHRGDLESAASYVPTRVAEELALIGPPHEVHSRLAQYREAGVDLPVFGIASLRSLYGPSVA